MNSIKYHDYLNKNFNDPLCEGLALLCNHLGNKISISELIYGLPMKNGSIDVEMAPKALRRAGLYSKVVNIDLLKINIRLMPVLLILRDGSTLLLISIKNGDALVREPMTGGGENLIGIDNLKSIYSGQAILAKAKYRPDNRAENYANPLDKHWLMTALRDNFGDYAYVGLAALMANLLAVGSSLFALQVYDRVVPNNAFETMWLLAAGALIAILFEFLLRVLRAHILETIGKRIDLKMSSYIFSKVVNMPLDLKPKSVGAFSNQVKEFESVRDFFTSTTAATISDIPFIFLFIGLVFIIGGPVAWVPFIFSILILIVGLFFQGKLAGLARENVREGAIKSGVLLESLNQMETVKTTRAQAGLQNQWDKLSFELAATSVKLRMLSTSMTYGSGLLQQICNVVVVIVGVYLISRGEMSTGGLVACTMLSGRAIAPMAQVSGLLTRWQHVKVALEGIDKIIKIQVDREDVRSYVHKNVILGSYRLADVKRSYEGQSRYAINIKDLKINAGEHVALLGGNGAGKSSLLRLLAGLYHPQEGSIRLDDLSITQIDPADLRHNIGYLPQDVGLFYGSLRDNLTPYNEGQSDDEMLHALDVVGLGNFVRSHERGLDLLIIDSSSVSGGQRQAIGLARLILQDPRVVILDEPTSSFDQGTEKIVNDYLKKWLVGRTLILATHKRSLLNLTERVLILRGGEIVMDGSVDSVFRTELIKKREVD